MLQLPVLWALGFGALPILQFGIAATALPILIHLLNRRKYREMRWAAMRFLVAALRKNQRRVKVEQWLLLAIRTLVVLLVVSAMAKPFLESLGAIALPGQRTHRVLVLDGSLSMAYSTAEKTRFDRAKALAAQLVRDTRRGDVLSIVLMGDPPRIIVGDASPSANQAEVLKEVDGITLPHGGTDLVASLGAIDRVLEVSTIPRKEVIFLTDLQAASWRRPGFGGRRGDEAGHSPSWTPAQAQSIVIDLGKAGGENRAVVGLRPQSAPVVTLGSTCPQGRHRPPSGTSGPNPIVGREGPAPDVDGQVSPDQSRSVDLRRRRRRGGPLLRRDSRRPATTSSRPGSTTTPCRSTTGRRLAVPVKRDARRPARRRPLQGRAVRVGDRLPGAGAQPRASTSAGVSLDRFKDRGRGNEGGLGRNRDFSTYRRGRPLQRRPVQRGGGPGRSTPT